MKQVLLTVVVVVGLFLPSTTPPAAAQETCPLTVDQAASFVQTIQERQGLRASCPEEISFRQGWIDTEQLARLAKPLEKTEYGQYLRALAEGLDI